MYRIILAKSHSEGVAYAKDQGWKAGTYRIASRAATIKGLRVAEVHELASFSERLDTHAVRAALRYAKIPAYFLIDDGWPPAPPEPEQAELFSWGNSEPVATVPVETYHPIGDFAI